ncbi:small ribosomal subunit protein mS26 [Ambystoma mexicanum]|uniref:small ribosomal subunit protein mS26 n=1 Tax=Ambystoma mexicanum TaxID=8296 RepID=UPI0037E8F79B
MAASRCLVSGNSVLRAAPCFLRLRPPLLAQSRGRKSRSDPPAKSKAGRIKLPPPVDPEELVVVQGRYLQYKGMMAALRADFKEEVLRKQYEEKVGSLAAERMKHETEEHQMLMAWNDAENARLRKKREERYAQEQEQEKQRQLQATISREAFLEKCRMEREEEILQLQEEAKHFVTLENLDQRIEEALDNPKNLNFAVDKEGRVAKRTALQ